MASKLRAFWIFLDFHLIESKTCGGAACGVPLFSLSLLERAASAVRPQPVRHRLPLVFAQEDSCSQHSVAARLGHVAGANAQQHCCASTSPAASRGRGSAVEHGAGGPQRERAAGLSPVGEEPASTHRWDVEQEPPHAHP